MNNSKITWNHLILTALSFLVVSLLGACQLTEQNSADPVELPLEVPVEPIKGKIKFKVVKENWEIKNGGISKETLPSELNQFTAELDAYSGTFEGSSEDNSGFIYHSTSPVFEIDVDSLKGDIYAETFHSPIASSSNKEVKISIIYPFLYSDEAYEIGVSYFLFSLSDPETGNELILEYFDSPTHISGDTTICGTRVIIDLKVPARGYYILELSRDEAAFRLSIGSMPDYIEFRYTVITEDLENLINEKDECDEAPDAVEKTSVDFTRRLHQLQL